MARDTEAERFQAFFDSSPDALFVVGPNGRIRRANQRVQDLFGYDPTELVGEKIERLVPESDRDAHPAQRDTYFEDPDRRPMGASLELRARCKDGTTVPVDVSLSPIDVEGETEVIAAVRDTTEQERFERKYRTLLQTAPDAVFVSDAVTGEILEVNDAAVDLAGVPESDLVGSQQAVIHPREDVDRYRALFDRPVEADGTTVSEFDNGDQLSIETPEDGCIPVEISAQRVKLDGRHVICGMYRDVSERRENELELYRQIDRLERLAEVLSHDLRNPLNVAEGNLQLARQTGDYEQLAEVERAHDRMRDIVEDVLTMVRGGAEVETVDAVEFGMGIRACWQNVATADADLVIERNGVVYADESRLTHLIENLVRNAVEHAGDDATVTVGILDGGFYVADDGPGIPEGERESVFESGWTTNQGGSGLGLSIVADIAAAHDWNVDITDSNTSGARFEFTGVRTAPYDDAFAAVEN